MNEDGTETSPNSHLAAKLIGLIPVVLIAAVVVAFMFGFRIEERKPATVDWRVHAIAEQNFSVTAPGVFIVDAKKMIFDGDMATARFYQAVDMGADFSVLAVRRPDSDARAFGVVATSLGLTDAEVGAGQQAGPLTIFRHDATQQSGTRTQIYMIFTDRMMYQLSVSAPARTFSTANAERFFGSFRLLPPS